MAITTEKIQTLLRDLENDSVERTISTTNTDKCGVLRVEEELKENGNGEPEFSLNLGTAFMVIEHISSSSNEDVNEEKSEESGGRNDNSVIPAI